MMLRQLMVQKAPGINGTGAQTEMELLDKQQLIRQRTPLHPIIPTLRSRLVRGEEGQIAHGGYLYEQGFKLSKKTEHLV